MSKWDKALSSQDYRGVAFTQESLAKGKYSPKKPPAGINSLLEDPMAIQYAMGYKDRKYSLSYDVLKRIPQQLAIVNAIFQTRINQIASFAVPMRMSKSLGYEVKHKDPSHNTTDAEREMIQSIETFIYQCGASSPNPHNEHARKRDDFETFLRKIVRDSLMYDQCCAIAGTWIELANGTGIAIENIEKGMSVRTHTGAIKEVLHPTQRMYSGDMVQIVVRGQKLVVTGGHPVFAAKRTSHKGNTVTVGIPEWIAARDLTPEMYVIYPRRKNNNIDFIQLPIFNEEPRKYPVGPLDQLVADIGCHPQTVYQILSGSYTKNGPTKQKVLDRARELDVSYQYTRRFEEETTVDDDWGFFTGLYLAEGHVFKTGVGFTFHKEEAHLIEFIRNFGAKYGIHSTPVNYEDRQASGILLNSAALASFIKLTCGKGSVNKKVPEYIFNSPISVQEKCLAAYFEGDGCIQTNKLIVSSISRDLFTGIRSLASTFGLLISETIADDCHENHAVAYRGSISGSAYRDFAERNGFKVDTQTPLRNASITTDDYIFTKISSIDIYEDSNVPVYNMEVADDHSYIAMGFLNHNCWEIVPNRKGEPYEFVAVDASTIRFAEPDSGLGPNDNWYDRNPVWSERGNAHEGSPFRTNNYKDFYSRHRKDQKPAFVQIVDGQIHTTYTADELAFGVRNPRTDLAIQGYGYSELEQAITIVTSHLYAEEYNRRFFMQGSAPKGLLNFKGDEMTPDMLEGFKRHWRANLEGVENSWKTLITQSEQGVEWIDLQKTNQDMEYSQWVEYLLKILCALFLIDPAELNFDLAGGVSQTPLFESSSEWKLKASRDRGLKPMLRFIAKLINEHIVSKIDDRFTFDFVGLDELTENEKHELRVEQLNSYKTMNEIRREQDLPDIEYGDVPSSPAYIQARAALIQEKLQQEQGAAGSQPAPGGAPQGGGQPASSGEDDKEEEEDSPAYADRFTKALPPILEVSFDDDEWISIVRDV